MGFRLPRVARHRALPPAARINAAVCASSSARRAHNTTAAPCFANSNAVALPIPDDAPMTATTLLFRFKKSFCMVFPVLSVGW
jgi:hypothetical protein